MTLTMKEKENVRGEFSSFLQSDAWEEFQRALGRETFRVAGALAISHRMPFKNHYLYCPRPNVTGTAFEKELEILARDQKAVFAKIDPAADHAFDFARAVATHSIQPQQTILADIAIPASEILSRMHEKTRYNIRLAERKGVSVSAMVGGFETFFSLLADTARRERFRLHEKRYYETLLSVSSSDFANRVFIAHYKGEPLASAFVNFYKPSGIATYLHGGSSSVRRDVMAPYLLHWEIMKEAARRGFSVYDFWGTDRVRWPGLTRFKEGFRGTDVAYPESADVVFRKFLYFAYRSLRRAAGRRL
ncbi:MAG: peptidoglycan bridge formation glycyltransferase FemA/FemB family protein [Patescibacteria group bacterium]